MDIAQAAKTIEWLDDERRKDKQEMVAQQERLAALAAENTGLVRRLQQVESELVATNNALQRLSKIDSILDGYRKEMARQLEDVEQRRQEAVREEDRLRKIERDAVSKALADLRKVLEAIPRLERDTAARRDEEGRVSRLIAELQLKVSDFNKHVDERNRAVTVLDEGRRQDVKRIMELQTETAELRRRLEEGRGKIEMVEDIARRTESRVGELSNAEAERRTGQTQWLDAQAIVQSERDRAWNELKERTEAALRELQDYAHRVEQYAETFREMKRAGDEGRALIELIERRVAESAEIHRLAEERFRQDWTSFLADDQKRWATHMLLRDEQWREAERLYAKQFERIDALEDQVAELTDAVRQMQALDSSRMQTLLNVVRELAADHNPNVTRLR